MAYWLLKSEPGAWSWDDQVRDGTAEWDGIRNHQANNNMKAMQIGDRGFFYHSVDEKRIVGIVEVSKLWYPDPSAPDTKFGMVDVTAVAPMPNPVTLADIKARPELADMVLVKNSRLSIQPVTEEEWHIICQMGGM